MCYTPTLTAAVSVDSTALGVTVPWWPNLLTFFQHPSPFSIIMKFLINANLGRAVYSSRVPSLALEEEGNSVIFLPSANWNTDKMLELKHPYYL